MNNTLNNIKTNPNSPVKNKKYRFNYTVKDQKGNLIKGNFDGYSQNDINSFLVSQGYQVVSIKKNNLASVLGLTKSVTRKISHRDLVFFLTQLSTYLKSGIPLIDSVIILSRQTKNKTKKLLYQKIVFELTSGFSLSEALEKQGDIFPRLLINMIKTSELTGNLTEVLDDMVEYYKTSDKNRRDIISAMTYPSVIFVFAVMILTFIVIWVVPQFTSMYEDLGSEVPAITLFLINFSDYLGNNLFNIIGGLALIIFIFFLLYKNVKMFRYLVQSLSLRLPVTGKALMYNELIMFTKTFASLINHDVFITDSMDILQKITNNEVYKALITDAVTNLSNGNGISSSFKNHWAFPQIAYEMLVTGEKTGRIGQMMQNVCNYYEEEQRTIISKMKSLIEPAMIVIIAIIVGIILLSVIVPMFSIYEQI